MSKWIESLSANWSAWAPHIITVLAALGVLIGGWIVALIVRRAVRAGLERTSWDERLASAMGMELESGKSDQAFAKVAYYIVMAFVLVAFFQRLHIDAVTRPILTALDGLASAVPGLLKAALIGLIAYVVASIVRKLVVTLLKRTKIFNRLAKLTASEDSDSKSAVTTAGQVAFWVVIFIAAVPLLEALQVSVLAAPLSSAIAVVSTYAPKVFAAAVLALIGYVLGRIVRALIVAFFDRTGADKLVARVGFGSVMGKQTVGSILGTIAMAFIVLQFAISAVGTLGIEAISGPLGLVLAQIYGFLPRALVAAVVLAVGLAISRVAVRLARQGLAALGFNALMVHLGVHEEMSKEAKAQAESGKKLLEEGTEGAGAAIQKSEGGLRTPADVAAAVLGVVIIVLFVRQALETLGLDGFAGMLDGLIGYLPSVFAAVVVLGAGMWAGRWAKLRIDELVKRQDDTLMQRLGSIARVAIVTVAAMIAAQRLGVGETIVTIAFAGAVGAVCLAAALAFGLGGKEAAAELLRETRRRQRGKASPPAARPSPAE